MNVSLAVHARRILQFLDNIREAKDLYRTSLRILIGLILILSALVMREAGARQKIPVWQEQPRLFSEERLKQMGRVLEPKPFSFYSRDFENRNIFVLADRKKPALDSQTAKSIEQFKKSLKLVGIIIDRQPQAVIEDQKSGKTFFLGPGESINGAVLEKIHEGSVILFYEEQAVELFQ